MPTTKVYSWSPVNSDSGIYQSFQWVREDYVTRANAIDPDVPVLFFNVLKDLNVKDAYDLAKNGIQNDSIRLNFLSFFSQVALRGIKKLHVVLDEEAAFRVWDLPGSDFGKIYGDKDLLKKLGFLKNFNVKDFDNQFEGRSAWDAWNSWAWIEINKFLRSAVELTASYAGVKLDLSNFGYFHNRFDVRDMNNWQIYSATFGNIDAPVVYNIQKGNKFFYNYPQYSASWINLIDCLNIVRGCSGRVIPWITEPEWIRLGDGTETYKSGASAWWKEAVMHMRHNGIKEFYYWNPEQRNIDFAHMYFSAQINSPRRQLPQIPYDATEIETDGYVTRREQIV